MKDLDNRPLDAQNTKTVCVIGIRAVHESMGEHVHLAVRFHTRLDHSEERPDHRLILDVPPSEVDP